MNKLSLGLLTRLIYNGLYETSFEITLKQLELPKNKVLLVFTNYIKKMIDLKFELPPLKLMFVSKNL